MYVLIIISKRAVSSGGMEITREGERRLVTVEPDGWVEATSSTYDGGMIPADAKLFRTRQSAAKFADRWEGHPWYCVPSGKYEIHEVEPVTKTFTKTLGYKSKENSVVVPRS